MNHFSEEVRKFTKINTREVEEENSESKINAIKNTHKRKLQQRCNSVLD